MAEPDAPQQPSAPPTSAPEPPAETQPLIASIQGVWERIKHHKVVQWTLAYLAIAYTLLHGAEMLAGTLNWSHGLLRLFTLILILGVPVIITLAWYHGARGLQRVSGTEFMIIALLLAIGGTLLWRDSGPEHGDERATAVAPAQPASAPATLAISEKSVAVLPFVDLSEKKDQEYFSDGLSEELLNLLTKVPQLQVAARTSSFYYKGKQAKLAEIARELHVAYLLEGSVRKSGNQVRITAQLIRAADGYHQWSETYDRTLEDIFAVQEEIAAAVVTQLQVKLLGRSPTVEITDPKAYALALQARHLGRQFTREAVEQSVALYQQALAIDPNYAVAWVGVARSYSIESDIDLRPVDEAFRLAREATNKALAIAPDYALANAGLGLIAMKYDGDLSAAARHYEKALAQEPANLDIIGDAGELALRLGRLDQAVALDEYAVTRDPVNPDGHDRLGMAYVRIGRLDDAITSWRTALRLNPGRIAVQMHIGWALLLKGDGKAALAAMQQESVEFARLIGLSMAHHTLGNLAASDAALNELIGRYGKGGEYNIAYVLAWRGETDRAFEWLIKALAYRVPFTLWADRLGFANLQDDPRWLPFLRKHGMAPEQLAAIKFEVKLPQ